MMKREFETLAKRTVMPEQYEIIEKLYMESTLDKADFVKSIKGLLATIPEQHDRPIKTMAIHNMFGDIKTPNGCWYMTIKVELVDVDIKTGKVKVKKIPNSFEHTYSYDFTDYWDKLEFVE